MPIFHDISCDVLLNKLHRTLGVHKWCLNLQTGDIKIDYGQSETNSGVHQLNIDDLRQLLNADEMRLHREHWDLAVRNGSSGPTTLAFAQAMGQRVNVESVCALYESDGRRYLIGFFKRISQSAELSRNARLLTEFLESFIAHSPSGIVVVDCRGQIVSANGEFLRFVGKNSRTDVLQRSAVDIMAAVSRGLGQVLRDALIAPKPVKGQCEIAYTDGRRQTLYWRAFPLSMNSTKAPPHVFAFDLNEKGARYVAA